jgi:chromosome segregation ATPase
VWNISTEKSTFIEKRQSHSIFKDDLSRIKTDLFQKEANLIEKNKELERRDSQIREIAGQLQANVAVSDALKKRIEGLVEEVRGNCEINQRLLREKEQSEKMGEEKCRKMQEELKSKEQTIANLRNSQCKNN